MQLIDPKPPEATLAQGFSYIKRGDLGKAISVMDELIQNDPYLAQAYWGRALCFECRAVNTGDIDHAIIDYSKSIVYSSDPSAVSHGRRGILYFRKGMYGEALRDLDLAVDADPFWIEARFYRGRTYLSLARDISDSKLAECDFTEVIRHSTEPFAPAYFWRAQARRLIGKESGAIADYEQALAFDPDDALALNALAYCSEHGIGTKIDRKRAEKLYEKSAESGFTVAQKNLAWFYAGSGDCCGLENPELSAYWMQKAADGGDAEAQTLYGLRLLHGKGVEPDAEAAARYFRLAAGQDYSPAMCVLAECFEHGMGVSQNADRAFELYDKAAGLGSETAAYNVGRCYYFGIGVEENNEKAFEALKPLADEGHSKAQDIVGMCYENGYGVPRDLKLAGEYYRAAYKQGHAHSALHLAARYRAGRGVKRSLAAAIRLYTEAAARGSSYAWVSLGRLYFEDKCDYEKAATAFRLAIEAGEENVSTWLARSLMHSKNPKAHAAEAYELLLKAFAEEQDPICAALFLCDFDYFGFCGHPINPKAAVSRVESLIPADGSKPSGLSCAYVFLAQSAEHGLGSPQDTSKAVELYLKAGAVKEDNGCRCFIAGFAHILYQGLGCAANKEAADGFVRAEIERNPENTNNEIRLLYIWSELSSNENADREALAKIARDALRDEPGDAMAAYMLYFLNRNSPDAGKHLKKLRKILEDSPAFYSYAIKRQLENAPGEVLYPLMTREIIDEFCSFD